MLRVWFSQEGERRFEELVDWKKQIVRLQQNVLEANDTNLDKHKHTLVVATLSNALVKKLGYVRVEFDSNTGKFHLDIGDMVITPLPEIPVGCIELVTLRETVQTLSAYRRQGVYHHEGTEAIVETKQRVSRGDGLDSSSVLEGWQEIRVSGPSIESVKDLYRLIRNGEKEPKEPWDDEKPNKERVPVPSLPASATQ